MSAIAEDLLRSFELLASCETWRRMFAERIPYEDGIELIFRDSLLWAFNDISRQFVASIEYKVSPLGSRHVDSLIFGRTDALLNESWNRFPPKRALEVGLAFLEFKGAYTRVGTYPCGGANAGGNLKKDIQDKLIPIWNKAQEEKYQGRPKECYVIAVMVGYYFSEKLCAVLGTPYIDPSVALPKCRAGLQRGLGPRLDGSPHDVSTYRRVLLNGESVPSDPRVTIHAEALLVPAIP